MQSHSGLFSLILIVPILLLVMPVMHARGESAGVSLTLTEVERIALRSDPLMESFAASAAGLREEAVADAQWQDPKLKLGMMNLPTDSFSRSREPMTQLQMGLQQAFPRGNSLEHAGEGTAAMAEVEAAKRENQHLLVLRSVRRAYLELYFHIHRQELLHENRELFNRLLEITERQYAVGRDAQHDVMRAQLELSLLDNRLLEAQGDEEAARAELAQWISHQYAGLPLAEKFPTLAPVPSMAEIRERSLDHPLIRARDAYVEARESRVAMAEEQYKPGWMLDITYSERTGHTLNGGARPDLFSVMVLVDIPLFTGKRQDKRLTAARKQVAAERFSRTDRLRRLIRDAEQQYAQWRQLNDRYDLYRQRALIDANRNTEVTLKAYQNNITDFTTLMRASLAELDIRLEMLRVRVERAKARAGLLYFTGDNS